MRATPTIATPIRKSDSPAGDRTRADNPPACVPTDQAGWMLRGPCYLLNGPEPFSPTSPTISWGYSATLAPSSTDSTRRRGHVPRR